jgi:class 3 adenylate cyclase
MSDSGGLVLDHLSSGRNLMFSGRLGSSRSQLKEVLALYDPISHRSLVHQAGFHPHVLSQPSECVGIATGLVVGGDLIGSGDAQVRDVVGETPKLAARLQGIAEPNTVIIAESTRRLLGNLFELEDLGAKELKGIAGPVPGTCRKYA